MLKTGEAPLRISRSFLNEAPRGEAVERRGHRRSEPFGDPAGDVSRGPPYDMRETADRLLVRDAHRPRALRLEVAREPAARLGPRHHRDHDPALRAIHPRHVGDKTAVYISHRLSSCKFCDDIAVSDHGAIVQYGTRDQLVADENGKYYELWHAQAQYYVKE